MHLAYYWNACPLNGSNTPNAEALEVVKSASNGEIPDWFYTEYQNADGSLNLEALWQDIVDIGKNYKGEGEL